MEKLVSNLIFSPGKFISKFNVILLDACLFFRPAVSNTDVLSGIFKGFRALDSDDVTVQRDGSLVRKRRRRRVLESSDDSDAEKGSKDLTSNNPGSDGTVCFIISLSLLAFKLI